MKKNTHAILIVLFLFFLSSCINQTGKEVFQTPEPNTLKHIAYCNINSSKLCVEGFGKDNNQHLIILFQSKAIVDKDITVYLTSNEERVPFICSRSEEFPENIYCTGPILPEAGDTIKIDAFSTDNTKLLGSGNFRIQYGQIEFLGKLPVVPIAEENTQSPASYPNYPNYPNQSP